MSSLISSEELAYELEQCIPTCNEINIISAFITMPGIKWLGGILDESMANVQLVGRFSPQDLLAGASDIKAIRACLNNGYKISALSNLHAKIYQVDTDTIFTGSANLTGKGLSLVEDDNLESCSKVVANETSKDFITKIIKAAIPIDYSRLDKMETFLALHESVESTKIPPAWPEKVISKVHELFVSDFPLSPPDEQHPHYMKNTSLEFAVIAREFADFDKSQRLFKQTKAYQWIEEIVYENTGNRDLGFGQVSKLLHDALSDDPAPYRQDIKQIQANLYQFIKKYAYDILTIHIPGRHSEVIALTKKNINNRK